MADIPPDGGAPPAGKDYRPEFTAFLNDQETAQVADARTRCIFSKMNAGLALEGQPMSRAHYQALVRSIASGDNPCQALVAEHSHVMSSSGSTPLYTAGKGFHRHIVSEVKERGYCVPSTPGGSGGPSGGPSGGGGAGRK